MNNSHECHPGKGIFLCPPPTYHNNHQQTCHCPILIPTIPTEDPGGTKHLSAYGASELKKMMLWCCKKTALMFLRLFSDTWGCRWTAWRQSRLTSSESWPEWVRGRCPSRGCFSPLAMKGAKGHLNSGHLKPGEMDPPKGSSYRAGTGFFILWLYQDCCKGIPGHGKITKK